MQLASSVVDATVNVQIIDWDPTGSYLAVGMPNSASDQELRVYYYNSIDNSLTLTFVYPLGATTNINALKWYPKYTSLTTTTSPALAVAKNSTDTDTNAVSIFQVRQAPGFLGLVRTTAIVAGSNQTSITWSNSGNYLIYGQNNANEIQAYSYVPSTGVATALGAAVSPFSVTRLVSKRAISFSPGDDYFAVATNSALSSPHMDIYAFSAAGIGAVIIDNGTAPLIDANANSIYSLDWSPTGSYIAVGFGGGAIPHLAIYKFAPTPTLTQVATNSDAAGTTVECVNWTSDGNRLLTTNGLNQIRIFSWDKGAEALSVVNGKSLPTLSTASCWQRFGLNKFGIALNTPGTVRIYGFDQQAVFQDVSLFFRNDIDFNKNIDILGNVYINMLGNQFSISSGGKFTIYPNSTLYFDSSAINLNVHEPFVLIDNTSQLALHNATILLESDIVFNNGGISISQGDTYIEGAHTFSYNSVYSSTIDSFSSLSLVNGVTLCIGDSADGSLLKIGSPLEFVDNTSELILQESTLFITDTGLHLLKGKMRIDQNVVLDIANTQTTFGLIIGDGTTANDFEIYLSLAASKLQLENGALIYKNNSNSRVSYHSNGVIYLQDGSLLYLDRPLELLNGILRYDNVTSLSVPTLSNSYFTVDNIIGNYSGNHKNIEYNLTGTIKDLQNFVLDTNDIFSINQGILTDVIVTVSRGNNIFNGLSKYEGLLSLVDYNSTVTWVNLVLSHNDITLNGGKLIIGSNLMFEEMSSLRTSGTVVIQEYILCLSSIEHTEDANLYIDSSSGIICLQSNITLDNSWTVSGNLRIHGNGYNILFDTSGEFVVERGSTLELQDVHIDSLFDSKLRCMDSAGTIKINNTILDISAPYTFAQGKLVFKGDSFLKGKTTFSYESNQSSVIEDGNLTIDKNLIASIGRSGNQTSNEPLLFTNNTSILTLDGATLQVTTSGMQLTKGELHLRRNAILDIQSTQTTFGLIIGDGTASNDCNIDIDFVTIKNGAFTYKNTVDNYINFDTSVSRLYFLTPATFNIEKPLLLTDGELKISTFDLINVYDAGNFTVQNLLQTIENNNIKMIGSFTLGASGLDLSSTDFFRNLEGVFNLGPLNINETGAVISGYGGTINSDIIFLNNTISATISTGLSTFLLGNIILNGGKTFLSNNVTFGQDFNFTGSGTIDSACYKVDFGRTDLTFTDSLIWINGSLDINSNLTLATSITFYGTTKITGNGHILDFAPGGGIYIAPGGHLILTELSIHNLGITTDNLSMLGVDSQIHMSNVFVNLSNNYTTTIGGIIIEGPTIFGLKNYNWTFDLSASVSIKGVTLWIDSIGESNRGTLLFGSPLLNYLTFINSGTYKEVADARSFDLSLSNSQTILTITDNINYNSQAIVTIAGDILIPVDLSDASGVIILDHERGVNFNVHPALSLHLTLSDASEVLSKDLDTSLKITDSIQIKGRDNVIDVSQTFTLLGSLLFEPNSELTFRFNDKGDRPRVYLSNSITISADSRLVFKNIGEFLVKDGESISFEGGLVNLSELSVEDRAYFHIEENLTDTAVVTFKGTLPSGDGRISMLNGGTIEIEDSRHLIIGNAVTDNFDIVASDNGLLKVAGMAARISLQLATMRLIFELGGTLLVRDGGVFEVNSLNDVAAAGNIGTWLFNDNGVLDIGENGIFSLGENISANSFNFKAIGGIINTSPSILLNGKVGLLSETAFIGMISHRPFELTSVSAIELVSGLLQRALLQDIQSTQANLSVSVLFIDSLGVHKVRLNNGQIASLDSGDIITRDDSTTGIVYGIGAGESSFAIQPRSDLTEPIFYRYRK